MSLKALSQDRSSQLAVIVIIAFLLVRLLLVVLSPLELYADEAQYWRWGDTLEWGYYSKPPMIAWVIHFSTGLFGDSEAGVRILAPVFHAFAALMLFLLSRKMFGSQAGLFTTLTYVLMPGIILSSSIISTDGVLFPFWCLALYLFWRLRERDLGWLGVIALGTAMGLGFLSKYAMIYFVIGIALTSLIDAPTRRAVLSLKGLAFIVMAALIFAPHMIWNAANEFKTVSHTVDNANLGGELFNLDHLPKFIGDQMGVFGPVAFLSLLAAMLFMRPKADLAALGDAGQSSRAKETWLACFIVPVLIIIAFQAVLSRAHANWAATAYPAASVLIGGFLIRASGWRWPFWGGIALQAGIAVLMATLALGPASWTSAMGRDNDFKRVRGWENIAEQLIKDVERLQPSAVLVDEREVWHGLDFYLKDRLDVPLILWRYNPGPKSYAETQDLTDDIDERVLVASYRSNRRPRMKADFASWQPEGLVGVDLGHRSNGCPLRREFRLYLASDYAPLQRTSDWVRKFKAEDENGKLIDTHIDRLPICPAK